MRNCNKLALVVFGLLLCICAGCAVNPITGQEELMLIPRNQDVLIGQKYAPEVEKQMKGRINNPVLQNYIDGVGQKIVRISHRPDLEFHFTAVEDKSLNAVALPGGYIFITRGMLESLQTEAQLASILAHEISHVIARDSAAAMSREIGIGILLSAATSEKTPQGVLTAADLTRQILGLRYSRTDEQEADLAGVDYMASAGYNPYGIVESMQILLNQQKTRPIEFFSSHPAIENRIEYLNRKIQTKYYNVSGLRVGKEDYQKAVAE